MVDRTAAWQQSGNFRHSHTSGLASCSGSIRSYSSTSHKQCTDILLRCSMPLTVFLHYHFCMSSEVDFVSARKRNGSSEFGISNLGDELTPAEPSSYEFMRTVVHLHRLCHSLPHRHSFIKTIAGRMEKEHQSIN